jgi:fucose permease
MKRYLAAALAAYATLGVATTMLGPLLPLLQSQWTLSDRQAGALFVAQFCGGFAGAIASGELTRRRSARFTSRLGFLLISAGFVSMPWQKLWMLVSGIALYGFGIGLAMPAITLAVCELFHRHSARVLNLLNLFWAIGAIAAPGIFLKLVAGDLLRLRNTLLTAAVVAIPFGFCLPSAAPPAAGEQAARALGGGDLRKLLSCALFIFAYVGVENGVAGWMPSLVERLHQFSSGRAALLQALFWTAFLLGRLLSSALGRPGVEQRVLRLSFLVAACGTGLLLWGSGSALLFAAAILLGLGLAPLFPTAVSVLSEKISAEWRPRLGWVFAAGGLGGAVLPYGIGALSNAFSSLRQGMSLLLVAEIVLLFILFQMRRW